MRFEDLWPWLGALVLLALVLTVPRLLRAYTDAAPVVIEDPTPEPTPDSPPPAP